MDNINLVLKKFILDATNLNAISTYSILNAIDYKIDMSELNHKNDPYLYKMPRELISEPAFIAYNKDIINSFTFDDNKMPNTIKDLLIIAVNDKSNYFLWQKPIKTIKKFLLSIQSEQLIEVGKLKNILAKHSIKNEKYHLLIELKRLNDCYISELISYYFEFEKQLENTEYSDFLFSNILNNTETFISQVDQYIEKIGIDQLSSKWLSTKYIFLDFLEWKK